MEWYKKILSFIIPISIQKISSAKHPNLSVQLYWNHLLLSTTDAVYSYGTVYAPFRKTFSILKNELPQVKSFLLLGTGLGSALKILQNKYHIYPNSILVDYDIEILELSRKYMGLNSRQNVEWVYMDAQHFLDQNKLRFDLICIDLFKDLRIPHQFKQIDFFSLCKNALAADGYCIFNLILKDENENDLICEQFNSLFSHVQEIRFKQNHFYICKE